MEGLDWAGSIAPWSRAGILGSALPDIPCERWRDVEASTGLTLLHYACWGDNRAAVAELLRHGLDVDAGDGALWRPAHHAIVHTQPGVLQVLCAAGADLRARTLLQTEPLEEAVLRILDVGVAGHACVVVLVANGARLATMDAFFCDSVKPWMVALEHGVLCCRAVVVALLGLKRRRGDAMRCLDRWLVREMAWAVWATRTNVTWQPRED